MRERRGGGEPSEVVVGAGLRVEMAGERHTAVIIDSGHNTGLDMALLSGGARYGESGHERQDSETSHSVFPVNPKFNYRRCRVKGHVSGRARD